VSYIRTPEALAEAIAALSREPLVAADTEARASTATATGFF